LLVSSSLLFAATATATCCYCYLLPLLLAATAAAKKNVGVVIWHRTQALSVSDELSMFCFSAKAELSIGLGMLGCETVTVSWAGARREGQRREGESRLSMARAGELL